MTGLSLNEAVEWRLSIWAPAVSSALERASAMFPSNAKVLEIGYNSGMMSYYMAALYGNIVKLYFNIRGRASASTLEELIMDFREINSSEYDLYASEVADIHLEAYSDKHMTALFSKKKIEEYYRFLVDESELFVIAFRDGEECVSGRVLGFIVAGPNVSRGVARFLKANRHYVLWLMLKNPSFLLQKTIAIVRSKLLRLKPSIANFRLLSIAVKAGAQSLGVGRGMLQFFEKILKGKDISLYGLSVRSKNYNAVLFYENNGFLLEKEVPGSKYYIKRIN